MRLPLILATCLVAACATTAGYERVLAKWVGHDESELRRTLGTPSNEFETGGRRFLVYTTERNVFLPEVVPAYQTAGVGSAAATSSAGGGAAMSIARSCTTTFAVAGSRVVSSSFKGNACTASE